VLEGRPPVDLLSPVDDVRNNNTAVILESSNPSGTPATLSQGTHSGNAILGRSQDDGYATQGVGERRDTNRLSWLVDYKFELTQTVRGVRGLTSVA